MLLAEGLQLFGLKLFLLVLLLLEMLLILVRDLLLLPWAGSVHLSMAKGRQGQKDGEQEELDTVRFHGRSDKSGFRAILHLAGCLPTKINVRSCGSARP